MDTFKIERSKYEFYTANAGLALVGQVIERYSQLESLLKKLPTMRRGIGHTDIAKSYIGMLCLGKNDFEAVTQYRDDDFFKSALGIDQVPSTETLRQRFDQQADAMAPLVEESSFKFLSNSKASITALSNGFVPLDIDVFPMDNSNTKKEGIERTYKGHFGYAPIGAYLGEEGWNLSCELRKGAHHSQKKFLEFLPGVVERARKLTKKPILLRLDSGHDALENLAWAEENPLDYIIKWNPRKESDWVLWRDIADEKNAWREVREGKEEAIFRITRERKYQGKSYALELVIRVIKKTMEANGQLLGFTDGEVEGWWTTLDLSDEAIIKCYCDHATSEQFHSEIKTDLDLERLPSGKFATNDLILSFGGLCYNILRWIGLQAPIKTRKSVKRRRLRTVILELMMVAARLICHSRRYTLRFGKHCPNFKPLTSLYYRLARI